MNRKTNIQYLVVEVVCCIHSLFASSTHTKSKHNYILITSLNRVVDLFQFNLFPTEQPYQASRRVVAYQGKNLIVISPN